ncbi:hypothetical protein CEXT_219611 [Caerostris extrusa]|uniref:Uncharacterized protein n=1 Tax=Caerostris extrusa TaxID=172846 RepID=A0AAV4VFP7_CAEEX|nr:hypothetical protein CEXT_219611 [Caerostris extrusa]
MTSSAFPWSRATVPCTGRRGRLPVFGRRSLSTRRQGRREISAEEGPEVDAALRQQDSVNLEPAHRPPCAELRLRKCAAACKDRMLRHRRTSVGGVAFGTLRVSLRFFPFPFAQNLF